MFTFAAVARKFVRVPPALHELPAVRVINVAESGASYLKINIHTSIEIKKRESYNI